MASTVDLARESDVGGAAAAGATTSGASAGSLWDEALESPSV